MSIFPTTIQNLKQKNKDLKILLDNEKIKRRKDREEFEYTCGQYKEKAKRSESLTLMLQKTITDYAEIMEQYKETIHTQKEQIEELKDQVAQWKGALQKNSSNSSKPPSTDGLRKPQRLSTREKSGKKPGGQVGHKGHTLSVNQAEKKVVQCKEGTCTCGGEITFGEKYQSRSIIDVLVTLWVTEERAYSGACKDCHKPFQAAFSQEFRAPVQYGNNLNALVATVNEYGNVADKKTAEIISNICGNQINMSPGTVVNIRTRLAEKLSNTVETIKQRLIQSDVLSVDETGIRVNGKLNWVHIFANDQDTLFEHNPKRSAHCDDEDGILAFFIGILVHDHFKAYYKNKMATHSECNQHILRYLKAVIEIQKHKWAKDIKDFLLSAKKQKEESIASGHDSFTPEEFAELEQKYLSILDKGDQEYHHATEGKTNIEYFKDERRLLARLREYKDEHLCFLSKFQAPFGNNTGEQAAHFLKNKTRVSGGFRSSQGADHHMKIASVIATAKKRKLNPYSVIKDSFNGLPIFKVP